MLRSRKAHKARNHKMTAKVCYPYTQTERTVKNLGWLLRNWKKVQRIEVVQNECENTKAYYDVILSAYCYDGTLYTTEFADKGVCWKWLQRPVFFTLPLMWLGTGTEITKGVKMPELP